MEVREIPLVQKSLFTQYLSCTCDPATNQHYYDTVDFQLMKNETEIGGLQVSVISVEHILARFRGQPYLNAQPEPGRLRSAMMGSPDSLLIDTWTPVGMDSAVKALIGSLNFPHIVPMKRDAKGNPVVDEKTKNFVPDVEMTPNFLELMKQAHNLVRQSMQTAHENKQAEINKINVPGQPAGQPQPQGQALYPQTGQVGGQPVPKGPTAGKSTAAAPAKPAPAASMPPTA